MSEFDPYRILQLDKNCSVSAIKDARRVLAWKHHPDRGGDPAVMADINKAAEILLNGVKRRLWDEEKVIEQADKDVAAKEILIKAVAAVLDINADDDGQMDVIKATSIVMTDKITEMHLSLGDLKKEERFYTAKFDSIKHTGAGENLLTGLIKERQGNAREAIMSKIKEIADTTRAQELLKDYADGQLRVAGTVRSAIAQAPGYQAKCMSCRATYTAYLGKLTPCSYCGGF